MLVVPQDSSSEEDQVDVVQVQSEGEDHHAQKRQAVHDQSRHPVKTSSTDTSEADTESTNQHLPTSGFTW